MRSPCRWALLARGSTNKTDGASGRLTCPGAWGCPPRARDTQRYRARRSLSETGNAPVNPGSPVAFTQAGVAQILSQGCKRERSWLLVLHQHRCFARQALSIKAPGQVGFQWPPALSSGRGVGKTLTGFEPAAPSPFPCLEFSSPTRYVHCLNCQIS